MRIALWNLLSRQAVFIENAMMSGITFKDRVGWLVMQKSILVVRDLQLLSYFSIDIDIYASN